LVDVSIEEYVSHAINWAEPIVVILTSELERQVVAMINDNLPGTR